MKAPLPSILAHTLRKFFSDYLPRLRTLSPHTIQSYRDTLVLLLRYVALYRDRPAAELDLDDIGTDDVIAFLNYLEKERGNTVSTRNVRLAALHAFFRFVAGQYPDRLEHAQRILGIPFKRAHTRPIEYFEYEEFDAILLSVDRSKPNGHRDYVLLATMFNTGARVSEIINIRACDLQIEKPYQVRLWGKGKKERICPLWPQTAQILRDLCIENHIDSRSDAPVFRNYRGEPLTRFGVRYILAKYIGRVQSKIPNLAGKRLHPHSVRHSTAIHLLKAGVDLSTIGHWLGHASFNTTNKYTAIDLDMKRKALEQFKPLCEFTKSPASWWKDATILEWLESL